MTIEDLTIAKVFLEDLEQKSKCNEISTLKEVLEKQRPKTPYFSGDGYWNGQLVYDTWTCPNCSKSYEVDYEEHDYCPNCGQAIKWENS